MLEIDLLGKSRAEFAALRRPKLLCVYSYRNDAALVPALRANLLPIVDGFVAWDDRAETGLFSNEPNRRRALFQAAKDLKADWVLAMDPDERLEPAAQAFLRKTMARKRPLMVCFRLREMYQHNAFRVDGVWGKKAQDRMFPLLDGMEFDYDPLHSSWRPSAPKLRRLTTDMNIYHLKMLTPERRKARRDLYAALDPERKYSATGYDYLDDETGLELEIIAPSRMYWPPHIDDGELWMAAAKADLTDPLSARFNLARQLRRSKDIAGADKVMASVAEIVHEFAMPLSQRGNVLLMAGQPALAIETFANALRENGADSEAHEGLVHGLGLLGRSAERQKAKQLAYSAVGEQKSLASLRLRPPIGDNRLVDGFAKLGWCTGNVAVSWGIDALYDNEMAVVVLALDSPPELANAVDSLLSQNPKPLVIVVNSGLDRLDIVLGSRKQHVISARVGHRVFAGAARNIGTALSDATWVAYLASDCLAGPGWVAERLRRHRVGARAVSSPVLPDARATPADLAAYLYLFGNRSPRRPVDLVKHYGLSYDRKLLALAGWFNPDMRIGEDSRMNDSVAKVTTIEFAAEVLTYHAGIGKLSAVLRDIFVRRRLSVAFGPSTGRVRLEYSALACLAFAVSVARRRQRQGNQMIGEVRRERADYNSVRVAICLSLIKLASGLARWREFPAEMYGRRVARQIVYHCRSNNLQDAAAQTNWLINHGRIGHCAAMQVITCLESAGLDVEAGRLFQHVERYNYKNQDLVKMGKRMNGIGRHLIDGVGLI